MTLTENPVTMRNMNILIVAWFRAPFGGLHSNIHQTALMLMERGHAVSIICPPGPFAEQMRAARAQVIETDFKDHGTLLERIAPLSFDIVHSHPGLSRVLAKKIAVQMNAPFFITFHGKWLDDIVKYWQDTTAIIGVSPAIVDEILLLCPGAYGRLHLIPNATYIRSEDSIPKSIKILNNNSYFNIIVATRLDDDKMELVSFLIDMLKIQGASGSTLFHWHFAGDGTNLSLLKEVAAQAFGAAVNNSVTFYGWLPESKLRELYGQADLTIAPGRSAIDALGLGLPTVAVGSAGCFGLVTPDNYQAAAYCNFGGFGLAEGKTAQTVFDDLTALITRAPEKLSLLGQQLRQCVRVGHDQATWDERLLLLYHQL